MKFMESTHHERNLLVNQYLFALLHRAQFDSLGVI